MYSIENPDSFAERKRDDLSEVLYFEFVKLFVSIDCCLNTSQVIVSIHQIAVPLALKVDPH